MTDAEVIAKRDNLMERVAKLRKQINDWSIEQFFKGPVVKAWSDAARAAAAEARRKRIDAGKDKATEAHNAAAKHEKEYVAMQDQGHDEGSNEKMAAHRAAATHYRDAQDSYGRGNLDEGDKYTAHAKSYESKIQ